MSGLIPQSFIDELVTRADIVEIIGRRVQLKRQGREFAGLCPFHQEKTPSFTVSPQKQFFHCFGCGTHGTVIGFMMRYEHLEFVEAIERLADEMGLEVPRDGPPINPHAEIFEALARAQRYYAEALTHSAEAKAYLTHRGIGAGAVANYGIGYAPGAGDALAKALHQTQTSPAAAATAGLLSRNARGNYDRFRHRLILPIRDTRGRTVGFGGRALGDVQPKYLNSPETPVFHKGRLLYGLYEAHQRARRLAHIVVVEGYLDVIALAEAGYGEVVATLGTAVTERQVEQLFRTGANEVIYCFDGDPAGERAAWRALEQTLPLLTPSHSVRFAFLPQGEDPDSLVRRQGLTVFAATIDAAQPGSEYLLAKLQADRLAGAEERARFAGTLRPLLARIRDGIYREMLTAEAAERVGLSVDRMIRLMQIDRSPAHPKPASPHAAVPPRCDPAIKRAIALLIAAPAEVAADPPQVDISGLTLAGSEILQQLLETLEHNPHLNTAGLLERWRTHPAAAFLGQIPYAYRDSIWQLAQQGQERQLAEEFRHTLFRLADEATIGAEYDRLESTLRSGRELGPEERQRLRQLQIRIARQKTRE